MLDRAMGFGRAEALPLLKAECNANGISQYLAFTAAERVPILLAVSPLAATLSQPTKTAFITGLGTLLLGKELGYNFHVYSDETRPLLQGARLTAFELLSHCTHENYSQALFQEAVCQAPFRILSPQERPRYSG